MCFLSCGFHSQGLTNTHDLIKLHQANFLNLAWTNKSWYGAMRGAMLWLRAWAKVKIQQFKSWRWLKSVKFWNFYLIEYIYLFCMARVSSGRSLDGRCDLWCDLQLSSGRALLIRFDISFTLFLNSIHIGLLHFSHYIWDFFSLYFYVTWYFLLFVINFRLTLLYFIIFHLHY